jgi:hypothetical protein
MHGSCKTCSRCEYHLTACDQACKCTCSMNRETKVCLLRNNLVCNVLARLFASAPSTCTASALDPAPTESPPRESSVFSFDIVPAPLPTSPALSGLSAGPSLPPHPRRRGRRATDQAPSRQSARIAALTKGNFVAVSTQAERRKALLNSLSGCSAALKKQVHKRNILTRNKLPIGASDIRKLLSAASVGCSSAASVGVSTAVAVCP